MAKKVILFFLFIFLNPLVANAQIVISEIMYNPEGSDTNREWIEIFNNGSSSVDINGWKLNENDTDHKINPIEDGGSLIIPANSYAVIVDKFEKFNVDYPNFSGIIFDSTFSLKNTGEQLVLKDPELNEIDSINYNVDLGAEGESLQLIDGSWFSMSPTPGESNNSVADQSEVIVSTSNETVSSLILEMEEILMQINIVADAGVDRSVAVGAETFFQGKAFGLEMEPLKNAKYKWNFGDGDSGEGASVFHNYQFPGEYIVVMNVFSDVYTASDRIIVKAVPVDIIVSFVDDEKKFIELFNQSNYELDLSWWKIKSGNDIFVFPKDTIILANKKLILPSKITNLNSLDLNQIYLLYPNEDVVNHYNAVNGYNSKYIEPIVRENPVSYFNSQENNTLSGEIEEAEEEIIQEYQTASINEVVSKGTEKDLFNKWTFSLGGIILVSIGGVLFASKSEGPLMLEGQNDEGLTPEDFEII